MHIEGLDKIDNLILEILKDNARMSYTQIGNQVGLSRVAVKNRIENMEKVGVIKGYKTMLDATKVPGGIKFFVDIEAVPEFYEDVVEMLSYDSRVRQIYSTTGSCKIHVCGFASSNEDVSYFTRNLFRKTKGIKRLEWDIIASTLKDIDGGVEYVRYEESEQEERST